MYLSRSQLILFRFFGINLLASPSTRACKGICKFPFLVRHIFLGQNRLYAQILAALLFSFLSAIISLRVSAQALEAFDMILTTH